MAPRFYQHSDRKNLRRKLRNKATPTEIILWEHLKQKRLGDFKFIRQYSVGPYILDFYCPSQRLGIELDGSQHAEAENQIYDQARSEFIEDLDIKILRFWNNEISQNIKGVCDTILYHLEKPV